MTSPSFESIFPECEVMQDSQAANRINTSSRGVYTATSVGGSITGKGADLLIIDDPIKDRATAESENYRNGLWEWYISTARTRMQPNGAIIVMATRWHEDDLSGRLLGDGGEEWEHLHLKAISDDGAALWPEWFNIDDLQKTKSVIGSYEFNSLYQGEPAPREGNMLKVENIHINRNGNWPKEFERIIQSIDSASKTGTMNDYSVIQTWGLSCGKLYLIDCVRRRLEFLDLVQLAQSKYNQFKPELILIEDASSGSQLIQVFNRELIPLREIRPSKDKVTRAMPLAAGISAGKIVFPCAEFVDDILHEWRNFPNAKHDDTVDAATMAYDYLVRTNEPRVMRHLLLR